MRWSQEKKYRVSIEDTRKNSTKKGGAIRHTKKEKSTAGFSMQGLGYLGSGLHRLLIAAKYLVHNLLGTWFSKSNILWLKIGVAGFAIIMVMREDFQFSVNFSGEDEKPPALEEVPIEEMGLVKGFSFGKSNKNKEHKEQLDLSPKLIKHEVMTDRAVQEYIVHFSPIAKKEMQRFGIPASLKMAQALLASEAGTNLDTKKHNNHFGKQLKGVKFDTDASNWRAHSLYLIENYPDLLEDAGEDYMTWVKNLEKTNYSMDASYTQQLLRTIKEYKLYQLDY